MARSFRPNHRIAAGTQATDGRLCKPDTSGPMPRRTTLELAIASPSGTAITSDSANPITARCTETQKSSTILPEVTSCQICDHTSAGAGSLNSGQNAAAHNTCQMTTKSTTAAIGGHTFDRV